MSQSDYIKYLRVSNQLRLDASRNQTPVFNASTYLDYKEYVLENTIVDKNICYSLLTPSGEQIVFGMERRPKNCPKTYECVNTNLRANRKALPTVYFTPTPQPLNWKQRKNAPWLKNGCICSLDSIKTLKYVCRCKTAT
jgi:hypothetical protein